MNTSIQHETSETKPTSFLSKRFMNAVLLWSFVGDKPKQLTEVMRTNPIFSVSVTLVFIYNEGKNILW
jgi:hypothetical protein